MVLDTKAEPNQRVSEVKPVGLRTKIELEERWSTTEPNRWRDEAQLKTSDQDRAGGTREPGEAVRRIVLGAKGGRSTGGAGWLKSQGGVTGSAETQGPPETQETWISSGDRRLKGMFFSKSS